MEVATTRSRVLVFGAGALGTFYGGRLALAGHDVTVVARGATLERIAAHGLRWREGRTDRHAAVTAVREIPDADFDWTLVLVRAQHLPVVVPLLADVRCPSVVMLVNNAGDLTPYRDVLGDRAVLGFPGAAGQAAADGVWACQTVPRWMQPTTVGELDGPATPRIEALVELLEQAGFPARAYDDMRSWLRYHAIWIAPLGFLGRNGPASQLARALHEGHAVLQAHGHTVSPPGLRWLLRTPSLAITGVLATVRLLPSVRRGLEAALAAGEDESVTLARQMVALADARGVAVPTWRSYVDG